MSRAWFSRHVLVPGLEAGGRRSGPGPVFWSLRDHIEPIDSAMPEKRKPSASVWWAVFDLLCLDKIRRQDFPLD